MEVVVQFKLLLWIFLTAFLLMPLVQAKDFRYCSNRGYPVKITGVTVYPDPVFRGKIITYSISASTAKPIDSGGEISIWESRLLESPAPGAPGINSRCSIYEPLQTRLIGIIGNMQTDQVILGGEMVIDISYYSFLIHSKKHNLCDETYCPISGDFGLSVSQVLPVYAAPGSYNIQMKLLGKDGRQLSCFVFDFTVRYPQLMSVS